MKAIVGHTLVIIGVENRSEFRYILCNMPAHPPGTKKEWLGKKIGEVHTPGAAARLQQQLKDVTESGQAVNLEYSLPGAEDRDILESTANPIFDAYGYCTHILIIGHYPITEQPPSISPQEETKGMLLEAFLDSTPDAVLLVNSDGFIIRINQAFEQMFGWSPEEIIGLHHTLLATVPLDLKQESDRIHEALWKESVAGYRTKRMAKDGTLIDVSMSCSPIKDQTGRVVALTFIYRNISGSLEKQSLQNNEEKYRLITENMIDIIAMLDLNGKFIYTSPSINTILGYPPEHYAGMPFTHFLHPEENRQLINKYELLLLAKTTRHSEIRVQHRNGQWIWLEIKSTPILDAAGVVRHIVMVARDISERKKYEQQLEFMAFYDYLTGVPNRRLFYDRLSRAISQAKRNGHALALLYMDCDRFKTINDTLGHDVGDELLKSFVQRIQKCIRDTDTIARLGGDEFAVLLTHVHSSKDVDQVATRILDELRTPWQLGEEEIVITSSIGISMYPYDSDNENTLIKYADLALYNAKQQGRNHFRYYKNDLIVKRADQLCEEYMRNALENNQFYLYYQPKYSVLEQKITGFEALIRWAHPDKGIMYPADFIPKAEQNGMIVPITEWLLHEVCRQNKEWQEQGYSPLPISVNISAFHFLRDDFVDLIDSALSAADLAPELLELEITESAIMKDVAKAITALQNLKAKGIRIAIDDFGAGFSSLSYIKNFAIDTLKIDKTFINDIPKDSKDAFIVETIIALAHNLNLQVVAEGVETKDQAEFLLSKVCDQAQGYHFSHPLSKEDVRLMYEAM